MTSLVVTRRRSSRRRAFTLLEMLLVLVISGILIAAIGAAINIHLRVSTVGQSEVEQAQLARALLRRIADDLRTAVPQIKPVESEAGATAADIAAAAGSASSGTGGASGGSGGSAASTGGASSSGGASGGSSSGGGSSSSSGSGAQTLQPLGTLQTLKPQSASSSSSGSASSGSGGSTGSSSSTDSKTSSTPSTDSESIEAAATTAKPPGIYGDQYTLQIDVSRIPRPGQVAAGAAMLDAPGDVKTVGYYLAPVTGAIDANGQPVMGLFRQSYDKAVGNFDAAAATSIAAEPQLLAEEVAAVEFRYFDGTAWQTSWDSSGGTLPTAVEIAMTFYPRQTAAITSSTSLLLPQTYRLTVAIPAAQPSSSTTSTDTTTESSTSSSSTSSSSGTTR